MAKKPNSLFLGWFEGQSVNFEVFLITRYPFTFFKIVMEPVIVSYASISKSLPLVKLYFFAAKACMFFCNHIFIFFEYFLFYPACHVLECLGGLAQDVITTVGQAFEIRFKDYLRNPPQAVSTPDR